MKNGGSASNLDNTNMLKVAITGSTGLVGSRITELLHKDFEFIPILQSDVDIVDKDAVQKHLDDLDFDIMLHLAAYTDVDRAEREKNLVHKINVIGTRNLYELVKRKNKKIVYFSTDFVFDGTIAPCDENTKPNPLGWYGRTKYEGELVVKNDGMIIRISYPYRAVFLQKQDFFRAIKSRLEKKEIINAITDTLITPTFIDDIAFAIKHLLNNFSSEVFHIVGSQKLSPYDACVLIAETFGLDKSLISKTTFDEFYRNNNIRPRKSAIVSLKNNFYKMRSFEDGLLAIKSSM